MIGAGTIGPFSYTSILPHCIQSASRSGEATERHDEVFPMERHWIETDLLLGDGLMGCRLSTYQARGFGKYEHISTNKVGLGLWAPRKIYSL